MDSPSNHFFHRKARDYESNRENDPPYDHRHEPQLRESDATPKDHHKNDSLPVSSDVSSDRPLTPCISVPEEHYVMAEEIKKADEANGINELRDIANVPKPFKNPNWKPSSRRNKTVKQILAEEARKEASALASQAQSGTATPADGGPAHAGDLAAAVLDKNARAAGTPPTTKPAVTYMSLDAPPSVKPKKKYCDITGLRANYTDPKTGLRYHDKEIFQVVRSLPQGVPEQYLEARNANTVLK